MNLSEFHILKSDGDEIHVKHPQGKTIIVKKSGLNKQSLKALEKMPKYADGGEVSDNFADPELNITPPEGMMFDPISKQYMDQPIIPTGRDAAAKYFQNDQSAEQPNPPEVTNNPVVGQAVSGDASAAVQPKLELSPKTLPETVASNIPDATGVLNQKQNSVIGALEEQKGYQQQLGQAQAGQAQAEEKAIDKVQKAVDLMQTQQEIVNQYKQKDDAFQNMLAQKNIDPNRYYKNLGTGQKVMQGIALVLGGIGAGLTGQSNAALGIIKDKIDQDIESQKNDQSKTMNLWKMNREQLGNDLAANLATQNQMYTGLKYQLAKAAAGAQSKEALARNGMAASEIDQKIAQNRQQISMIQIGLGKAGPQAQGADPSILVAQLVPPDRQAQAFKEIEAAQKTRISAPGILDAFDKAAKDVRITAGGKLKNYVPGIESAFNKELEARMGPTFADIEGTVRQAAMDNMAKNTHPQAFDSDETIAAKRAALKSYLQSKESAPTAKGFGIDLSKFKSTSSNPIVNLTPEQTQYYNWAISNPKDPKAQMVLKKLGVE